MHGQDCCGILTRSNWHLPGCVQGNHCIMGQQAGHGLPIFVPILSNMMVCILRTAERIWRLGRYSAPMTCPRIVWTGQEMSCSDGPRAAGAEHALANKRAPVRLPGQRTSVHLGRRKRSFSTHLPCTIAKVTAAMAYQQSPVVVHRRGRQYVR